MKDLYDKCFGEFLAKAQRREGENEILESLRPYLL